MCHFRGVERLRPEDLGLLWEHYVLNELQARLQTRTVQYWRDKRGREVDFVLRRRGVPAIAIECRNSSANFDAANLIAFRRFHPGGSNFVVARNLGAPFRERYGDLEVEFVNLETLIRRLTNRKPAPQ